jgi:bacterioferritin-associated ferredoxin
LAQYLSSFLYNPGLSLFNGIRGEKIKKKIAQPAKSLSTVKKKIQVRTNSKKCADKEMVRRMGFGKGPKLGPYIIDYMVCALHTVGRSHIGNIKGHMDLYETRSGKGREENDKQEKQTEQKKDLLNQDMFVYI